jgi:hypothetical protein
MTNNERDLLLLLGHTAVQSEAPESRKIIALMQRLQQPRLPHPLHKDGQHHTEIGVEPEDMMIGSALAHELGGLFIDKEEDIDADRPHRESYFYREMTSVDVWTRVARALRFHGLKIINGGKR